jgi:hypothetical protein
MVSNEPQVEQAAKPAAGVAPPGRERRVRSGLRITDEKLLWALQNEFLGNDSWQLPREKPATSRSRDKTSSVGGGSGGGRTASSPAKSQQQPRPTTSTAASHGSKQLHAEQRQAPSTAVKLSGVQEVASSKRSASAPTQLHPGKQAHKKPPLSKLASAHSQPAPSKRDAAPSKPLPAPAAAVAVPTAPASANGRPPKRLKAMLVGDLVTAATLSDSSSSSSSESESESDEESASEGEAESQEARVAATTAWEVGLNGAGLVAEEAGLLPPDASEAAYVRVSVAVRAVPTSQQTAAPLELQGMRSCVPRPRPNWSPCVLLASSNACEAFPPMAGAQPCAGAVAPGCEPAAQRGRGAGLRTGPGPAVRPGSVPLSQRPGLHQLWGVASSAASLGRGPRRPRLHRCGGGRVRRPGSRAAAAGSRVPGGGGGGAGPPRRPRLDRATRGEAALC